MHTPKNHDQAATTTPRRAKSTLKMGVYEFLKGDNAAHEAVVDKKVKEFDESDWKFQTTVDGMAEVEEGGGEGENKEGGAGLEKDETKKKGGLFRKVLGAMQKKQ